MILGKLTLTDRESTPEQGEQIALAGAGVVAGLATAFCTSIWFSAVEGEVYAMSTFFTTLTLWASMKWYALPDKPDADRWLIFAFYAAGLSVGVHLCLESRAAFFLAFVHKALGVLLDRGHVFGDFSDGDEGIRAP